MMRDLLRPALTAPAAALAILILPFAAAAGSTHLAARAMETRFTAIGPAGLAIVGTTTDGAISDDGAHLRVTVPLARLATGVGLRDRHLKARVLEIAKYPDAQLEVAREGLRVPAAGRPTSGDVTGTLRLHGQSHTVHVTYDATREGGVVHVDGALRLAVGDFGIAVPSYLGISVKPDVDVRLRFDVIDGS